MLNKEELSIGAKHSREKKTEERVRKEEEYGRINGFNLKL